MEAFQRTTHAHLAPSICMLTTQNQTPHFLTMVDNGQSRILGEFPPQFLKYISISRYSIHELFQSTFLRKILSTTANMEKHSFQSHSLSEENAGSSLGGGSQQPDYNSQDSWGTGIA